MIDDFFMAFDVILTARRMFLGNFVLPLSLIFIHATINLSIINTKL